MTLYETIQKTAIVIKIGNRYFERATKTSVVTAWSLAGAKIYIPLSKDLNKDIELLKLRKKKFEIITIGIVEPTVLT